MQVGATRAIRTIAAAARLARDGEVIEIDAGDYRGDVAVWSQNNLVIRGVGGRPRLDASGASAEGKGIFVVRGDNVEIDNLHFTNSRVPDQNGAGIRHETGRLVVRNSLFIDNEEGILTGNDASLTLEVYNSEFSGNGYGDGFSHNIYVGRIGKFILEGSYFVRGNEGHLVKTRARESRIFYNRITDESAGTASYEIDLPNGGLAYIVGNLIEQSPGSPNSTIVSYGAEGLFWTTNELNFAHNTVINNKLSAPSSQFVRTVASSTARLINNLFVGPGTLALGGTAIQSGNQNTTTSEFVNASSYDLHLRASSPLAASGVDAGTVNGVSLTPIREYIHPRTTQTVTTRRTPGAFQTPGS